MAATAKRILEDFQFAKLVYHKGQEDAELLLLLYQLYENGGRGAHFISLLANDEISRAGSFWSNQLKNAAKFSDLFEGKSLMSQFLFVLMSNDLGRKYFSVVLHPLMRNIDQKFSGGHVDEKSEDFVRFLMSEVESYIRIRTEASLVVPLRLREAFCVFGNCIAKKFQDQEPARVAGMWIAQKFWGPCLISPLEHGVFADGKYIEREDTKKTFDLIAKILTCVASGENLPSDIPHARMLNEFIQKLNRVVMPECANLMDQAQMDSLLQVLEANIVMPRSPELAESNLLTYLNGAKIRSYIDAEVERKIHAEQLIASRESQDFSVKYNKKDTRVTAFELQNSVIWVNRIETLIKKPKEKCLQRWMEIMKSSIDDRKTEVVEIYDENHLDFYVWNKPPFPFKSREFLFTLWVTYHPKEIVGVSYSIERADKPPKHIRGTIEASGFFMKEHEDNPQWTRFEIVYKIDIGGSAPSWLNNISHKVERKRLQKFREMLEHEK